MADCDGRVGLATLLNPNMSMVIVIRRLNKPQSMRIHSRPENLTADSVCCTDLIRCEMGIWTCSSSLSPPSPVPALALHLRTSHCASLGKLSRFASKLLLPWPALLTGPSPPPAYCEPRPLLQRHLLYFRRTSHSHLSYRPAQFVSTQLSARKRRRIGNRHHLAYTYEDH